MTRQDSKVGHVNKSGVVEVCLREDARRQLPVGGKDSQVGRINEAVGEDLSFVEAFPQKAEAELDGLRQTFVEKAFLARQHAVLESLPERSGDQPAKWTIAELEGLAWQSRSLAEPVARYLALRRPLGGTTAFVTARGEAVAPSGWPAHRRDIRRTAMTMAANAEHCRVLASARLA